MRIRLMIAAVTMLILSLFVVAPAHTSALFENAKDEACNGINLDTGTAGCSDTKGSVNGILSTAINIFSLVVGIIAVIMVIIGGLKYVTSQGDSSAISGAKNTVIYAIVGLVIVALAQVIVRFALTKTKPLPKCAPGQTQNCTP